MGMAGCADDAEETSVSASEDGARSVSMVRTRKIRGQWRRNAWRCGDTAAGGEVDGTADDADDTAAGGEVDGTADDAGVETVDDDAGGAARDDGDETADDAGGETADNEGAETVGDDDGESAGGDGIETADDEGGETVEEEGDVFPIGCGGKLWCSEPGRRGLRGGLHSLRRYGIRLCVQPLPVFGGLCARRDTRVLRFRPGMCSGGNVYLEI